MDPGSVPAELQGLSEGKELLIAVRNLTSKMSVENPSEARIVWRGTDLFTVERNLN